MKQKSQNATYLSSSPAYLEASYEAYLDDPTSVSEPLRAYFDQMTSKEANQKTAHQAARAWALDRIAKKKSGAISQRTPLIQSTDESPHLSLACARLIDAHRRFGYVAAKVNPLEETAPAIPEWLTPAHYGITSDDLKQVVSHDVADLRGAPIQDVLDHMRTRYCGRVGIEYGHLTIPEEVAWLRERLEREEDNLEIDLAQKRHILKLLTAAEGMESYLARRYVGQKRFSLEGTDSLIPMLHRLVHGGRALGSEEIVIGMAHRGRLNVMLNIVGCLPSELIAEFEGTKHYGMTSGDVKYHNGYSADIKTEQGTAHVSLAFNPSHLEAIFPVMMGSVRARLDRYYKGDSSKVLPIILHGDASLSGQGVVMEAMNMSQTRAHRVGGCIHIVVNNQVGFTMSDKDDARSSPYGTDIAKMIDIPIFRASGDDPEALWSLATLALDYRQTFGKDVMIDLVGYRRLGHNEADEPALTQPLMYQIIRQHPTPRALYAKQLEGEGVLKSDEADALLQQYDHDFENDRSIVPLAETDRTSDRFMRWQPYIEQADKRPEPWVAPPYDQDALIALGKTITSVPKGFQLHRIIHQTMSQRQLMVKGERALDWGCAETLAYATLLKEGISIRLVGEDAERATFAHRHAVLHDQKTGERYVPLHHVAHGSATFEVYNSLLSEFAALGFEYGYASFDPNPLVLWEAQFGDFANGAQVIIDQFISSAWQKWRRLCGLVMLLPHGYEAMGPEHSSARLERYLQLSAQYNMQVCMPSTPAQMFHLLRRQALCRSRTPLIVMTPKSFLRHKKAVSSLEQLACGQFQPVIKEQDTTIDPNRVTRVVLCSGKIYYELLQARSDQSIDWVALIRVEELYPFPSKALQDILRDYRQATEIIWCQEEPRNQGAWRMIYHELELIRPSQAQRLGYAGRAIAAAPAAGYAELNCKEQQAVIAQAFVLDN